MRVTKLSISRKTVCCAPASQQPDLSRYHHPLKLCSPLASSTPIPTSSPTLPHQPHDNPTRNSRQGRERQTHPLFTLVILIHSSHMLIPIGVHRIGLVEPVSLFFCQFLGLWVGPVEGGVPSRVRYDRCCEYQFIREGRVRKEEEAEEEENEVNRHGRTRSANLSALAGYLPRGPGLTAGSFTKSS